MWIEGWGLTNKNKKSKGRKQVKDFERFLKDIEPYVKNPKCLYNGRNFGNFSQRPRECLANWLLCVILRFIHGEKITFGDDDSDGIILDKESGKWIRVEHVSALRSNPCGHECKKGEDCVIDAINRKINKGPDYAANKNLIVFFDGAGQYNRSKIRQDIAGKHNFQLIYCIALLTADKNGYAYAVTELHEKDSITFKVQINADFTDWEVSQITE